MPKSKLLLLAAVAASPFMMQPAQAEYPERPVTLVVAFAGVAHGTDVTPSSPENYAAFIDKDEAERSKIVKASGAKGE